MSQPVPDPGFPDYFQQFLKPAWTSPTWWFGVLVTVSGLVTGFATWVGHPLHGAGNIPDAVVSAGAFLAASIATFVINHSRAHVVASAMNAAATMHAAAFAAAAVTPPPAPEPVALTGVGAVRRVPVKRTTTRREH